MPSPFLQAQIDAANNLVAVANKILNASGRMVAQMRGPKAGIDAAITSLEGVKALPDYDPDADRFVQTLIDSLQSAGQAIDAAIAESATALGIDPQTGADVTGGVGPTPD